jgi:hypothetical protein
VKARNRPPKLTPATPSPPPPPPEPTPAELLARKRLAGPAPIGARELHSLVARVVYGDRGALGGLTPLVTTAEDAWRAVQSVYGTGAHEPAIDPDRAARAVAAAGARLATAARAGGRIALASARPAESLGLFLDLARLAARLGGMVVTERDAGPLRIDGREPRWLRWLGGVAVVTDRHALYEARAADAAAEWMFLVGRPALVVADGPFAERAWHEGIPTLAFAGLDRPALAVAAATGTGDGAVVPVHGGRPPVAYEVLAALLEAAAEAPLATAAPAASGADVT